MRGVSSYKLATVRKLSTTRSVTAVRVVTGTSYKPQAMIGETVRYALAANVAHARWSRQVTIKWPVPAPLLRVSGSTLTWPAIPATSSYTLAIVRNPSTSRDTTYQTVTGTSFTPPATPGQTVNYGLAANLPHAPWAREVTITWGTPGPTPAPTPATPSQFVKGMSVDLTGWGDAAQSQIASELSDLGAGWDRVDLSWADTETSPGVYDWSHMDALVAAANTFGIHLLPVVGYAPSWTTPEDAQGYASFVAAAVRRYGPGTNANLSWFELWNEPNDAYAWSGRTAEPQAYARDVRAAAQAAKQVAPSVKVLMYADYEDSGQTGGSAPWQTTMIDDYFAAVPDLARWVDAVAVHPYGDDPANPTVTAPGGQMGWKTANGIWSFGRIDAVRQTFLAHGADLPIWITEVGWSTWDVSPAQQATNYHDLIIAVQQRPWIRGLFAFCLREFNPNPTNDQPGYGLLTFGTWQPKPAYQELKNGFAKLS